MNEFYCRSYSQNVRVVEPLQFLWEFISPRPPGTHWGRPHSPLLILHPLTKNWMHAYIIINSYSVYYIGLSTYPAFNRSNATLHGRVCFCSTSNFSEDDVRWIVSGDNIRHGCCQI